MTLHRIARHLLILSLVAGALGVGAPPTWADRAEGEAAIADAAAQYGAPLGTLRRIVECESHFEPGAVGDSGRSHGLVQLNDRSTGLIWHFYAVGYTNAYDATQAANYLARVAVGTWAADGVTLGRWSCA